MKILLVPTSYPDEANTIRNIFVYEQAKALSREGHEIRILHPQKQPSNKVLSKINKEISVHDDGYAVRFCRPVKTFMEGTFASINKILFLNAINDLYRCATADGWNPDVIYAHFSCWAGYAAVMLGKQHHIPVAVMEHYSGYMNDNPPHKLVDGLRFVVENANALLCVSYNLKERVIQLTETRKQIYVVPNMIDPIFQYHSHDHNERFVFCAVCNLNARKRVKELVNAFCKAFNVNDNVDLVIGGDGPEKNSISDSIKHNNRENQVHLLGRLDRKATAELYNRANCFALVSAHETFGIVWREAMAVGLPVITSNHEGWTNEDWSDDFGIMVRVDSEEDLIKAMRKMKNDYDMYDRRKISKYCVEHYSETAVVSQIEDVLRKVCVFSIK